MGQTVFCGRNTDLDGLKKAWSAAIQPGHYPQIVVLLGDSGMGKTRLAQELYGALAATQDPGHYWPGTLGQTGRNLHVNPPLSGCGNNAPPFLWWGLRFSDKTNRNAVAPSPIDADLPILAAHLARLTHSIRDNNRRSRLQYLLTDFAADVGLEFISHILPGVAAIKAGVKTAERLNRLRREHVADRPNVTLSELAERESRDKSRRLAEIFISIMSSGDNKLPICILADDGHFSESDTDAVDLLKDLVAAARTEGWPFLLVVTLWAKEWNEKKLPLVKWLSDQAQNFTLLTLGKIDDLSPLLKEALPGLTPAQATTLIRRVDGNPEFLENIIAWLRTEKGNFVARDLRKALTAKGLDEVMKIPQDRHRFALQRVIAAGEPIRQVLALGSVQGMRFLTDLILEIASKLELAANLDAVRAAERPHAFVISDGSLAEFVQRLYLEVATADLPNVADEEQVRLLLIAVLKDRLDDRARLASLDTKGRRAIYALALSLLREAADPATNAYARRASIALIDELMQSQEFQAAGLIAAQVVDRWIRF